MAAHWNISAESGKDQRGVDLLRNRRLGPNRTKLFVPGRNHGSRRAVGHTGKPDPFSLDFVFAYGGNDNIQLDGRQWEVYGGSGNDLIDGRGTSLVIVNGGSGDDTMYGGDFDNWFDFLFPPDEALEETA